MLALPSQTPGLRERHGLTRADTDRAAWAFGEEGRFEGAAAINRALRELGGAWRWLAALYGVPGLRQLEDGVYAVVARTRHHLSALTRTTPECDDPGVDCLTD